MRPRRAAVTRVASIAAVVAVCLAGTAEGAGAKAAYHTVRRGQTLYSIARSYGVPLERLAAVNRIPDPSRVRAGARLIIPVDRPYMLAEARGPVAGGSGEKWLAGRIQARRS